MAIDPITMMAIASTGLQIFGASKSASYGAGAALQSAELALIDAELLEIQAKQTSFIRRKQFEQETAVNENLFMGAMGRDISDPSVQAFLKRQEKTIAEDEMRASAQTSMQKINKQIEAASQRSKSKNIIRSGKVSMLTSAADFGFNYKKTKGFTEF